MSMHKSLIVKRSVVLDGHKTSVSLEDEFWEGVTAIAHGSGHTISEWIGAIDKDRKRQNLSSYVRLAVLAHYRDRPQKTKAA